ncbi:MAG: type II secretion system F family protein [Pirellulaceae bacterium]|nr:type II secretion system F family protein [Pirellulaceae bacterium]
MKQFSYIARNQTGSIARGTQTADSPETLRGMLQRSGLSLISFSIQERSWQAPTRSKFLQSSPNEQAISPSANYTKRVANPQSLQLSRWLRPSQRAIETALRQLAMMLRSGLDLISALHAVAHQSSSAALKYHLQQVIESVHAGNSLSDALACTNVFPQIAVQLVGVGEASGNLSHVLEQAAHHLAQRRSSINTVRVALAYPAVVATAAVCIAFYLIFAVIPQLQKFLEAMGRKLPAMTQSLVDLSLWLQTYGQTLLVVVVSLLGGLIVLTQWPPARLVIDRLLLQLPMIGSILRLSGTATLASSLAVMVRSGLKLVESLTIAQRLQGNQQLAKYVEGAREAVLRGEGLTDALATQPGYVPMLSSMLDVAERTGQLETSLEEVASFCESELQAKVKRLSLLIEPAIIVVAGGIVGYVYMAFFMALMSAGGNIR